MMCCKKLKQTLLQQLSAFPCISLGTVASTILSSRGITGVTDHVCAGQALHGCLCMVVFDSSGMKHST